MDTVPKMKTYKTPDEDEFERINKIQKDLFNKTVDLFDPPLQEGVPERLEQIVASKFTVNAMVLANNAWAVGDLETNMPIPTQ
jgi:hypothetical protein